MASSSSSTGLEFLVHVCLNMQSEEAEDDVYIHLYSVHPRGFYGRYKINKTDIMFRRIFSLVVRWEGMTADQITPMSALVVMLSATHLTGYVDKPSGRSRIGEIVLGMHTPLVWMPADVGDSDAAVATKGVAALQVTTYPQQVVLDAALTTIECPHLLSPNIYFSDRRVRTGLRMASKPRRFDDDDDGGVGVGVRVASFIGIPTTMYEEPALVDDAAWQDLVVAARANNSLRTRRWQDATRGLVDDYVRYWCRQKFSKPCLRNAFVPKLNFSQFTLIPPMFAFAGLCAATPERAYVYLMRAVCRLRFGQEWTEMNRVEQEARAPEIISMMCTMMVSTMPYVPDQVVISRRQRQDYDQWQNAWFVEGGDCDDSGIAIKSMLDELLSRRQTWNNKSLRMMTGLVYTTYRAALCVCTVTGAKFGQTNPNIELEEAQGRLRGHVVTLLIHRSFFDDALSGTTKLEGCAPVWVLEGTDAVYSNWGKKTSSCSAPVRGEEHVQQYMDAGDTYYRYVMTAIVRPDNDANYSELDEELNEESGVYQQKGQQEDADVVDFVFCQRANPDVLGVTMSDVAAGNFCLRARDGYNRQQQELFRYFEPYLSVPFPILKEPTQVAEDALITALTKCDPIRVSSKTFAGSVYLEPLQLFVGSKR